MRAGIGVATRAKMKEKKTHISINTQTLRAIIVGGLDAMKRMHVVHSEKKKEGL